jgi:thiosulfate dehydrogenase (quinone) large subunit
MDQKSPQSRAFLMSTSSVVPAVQPSPLGRASPVGEARAPEARTFSLTRATAIRYLWAVTRLGMAWTFLWPFLDKTFGLGHETASAQAWISGGNPSKGFLSGSVGAFSGFYQSIAGAGIVNWLFMVGLLAIAVSLSFGIAMRFAAAAGSLMLLLMWSASLPPQDDLFLDNHIIYALLLIGLALVGAGNTLGLGRRWTQTSLVRRYPWLT